MGSKRVKPMARIVNVKMSPAAYAELDRRAREADIPLNEYCLRLLMSHPLVGREELSEVPRKSIGRPRNPELATS